MAVKYVAFMSVLPIGLMNMKCQTFWQNKISPVEDALLNVRGRNEVIGDNRPPHEEAFDKALGLIVNSGLSGP